MNKTVKFGIVGCGTIAPWHIRAIGNVEGAEVTAVLHPDAAISQSWAETYGAEPFTRLEDMLCHGDIDAVSVCTPSGQHAGQAIAALQAGKHAVVEKPMSITEASLQAMLEAERQSTAAIFPICQLRLTPDIQAAKELIEQGVLGKLVMADLSMKEYRSEAYYKEKKWRGTWELDGGGALMNQGIHGLDLLRYLCGDVKEFSCRAGALCHNIQTEDTLAASLVFENGCLGVMTATTSVYPGYRRRMEICGTKGSMIFRESELIELHTDSGLTLEAVKQPPQNGLCPQEPELIPHVLQYRDIVRAITTGVPPRLTSEDAAETVRHVLSLYRAAGIGQKGND